MYTRIKTLFWMLAVLWIGVYTVYADPNDIGIYSILIGNKPIDKTEQTQYKTHDKLDHRITIFLNENPIHSMTESTVLVLNPFIKPGKNSIQFVSDGAQHIEAMITTVTWNYKVINRTYIAYDANDQNSSQYEYVLTTYMDHEYACFSKQNQLPQKSERVQKGALELLKTIFRFAEKRRYQDVANVLASGIRIWLPYWDDYKPEMIDNYLKRIPQFCDTGLLHFQQYEPEEYVIKQGKNLILVYRKDGENVLFRSRYSDSPTVIAYIKGKYIIWKCAPD